MNDRATGDIWIYDFSTITFTRVVYGWDNNFPDWTPDGTRLTFDSNRLKPDVSNLFTQASDGTGESDVKKIDASALQRLNSIPGIAAFTLMNDAVVSADQVVAEAQPDLVALLEAISRSRRAAGQSGSLLPTALARRLHRARPSPRSCWCTP